MIFLFAFWMAGVRRKLEWNTKKALWYFFFVDIIAIGSEKIQWCHWFTMTRKRKIVWWKLDAAVVHRHSSSSLRQSWVTRTTWSKKSMQRWKRFPGIIQISTSCQSLFRVHVTLRGTCNFQTYIEKFNIYLIRATCWGLDYFF